VEDLGVSDFMAFAWFVDNGGLRASYRLDVGGKSGRQYLVGIFECSAVDMIVEVFEPTLPVMEPYYITVLKSTGLEGSILVYSSMNLLLDLGHGITPGILCCSSCCMFTNTMCSLEWTRLWTSKQRYRNLNEDIRPRSEIRTAGNR
jgi:hypothetical protein